MKTRATDTDNKIRKKYFRQPKIYQNDYVEQIYNKKMFREFHTLPDQNSKEHTILFLFFVEKQEHFMLVGRDDSVKYEESESGSSAEENQINDNARKYRTTQDEKDKKEKITKAIEDKDSEEDDDSPYFVKITLDGVFLSHLEMPDIVSSSELVDRYGDLIENEIFKQIIQREVTMMFGAPEKSRREARVTVEQVDPGLEDTEKVVRSSGQASALESSTSSKKHREKLEKIREGSFIERMVDGSHDDGPAKPNLFDLLDKEKKTREELKR